MDETNNQSKDNKTSSSMLSRSAQILQAAAPYLDQNSTRMLESVVRMTDFFDTIQSIRQRGFPSLFQRMRNGSDTVSMTNLAQAQPPIDSEALLRSIRPFCSSREGAMIDQIMNIFNIQKAFSMYQTITNMMSMMNGTDNPDGTSNHTSPFMNMNGNMDMNQMMNMASMMGQMMNSNSTAAPNDSTDETSNSYNDSTDETNNSYNDNDDMGHTYNSDDDTSYNNPSSPTDDNSGYENTYNSTYEHNTSSQDTSYNTNPQDTYWNSQNMNYRHSYGPDSDSNPNYNSTRSHSNNTDEYDDTSEEPSQNQSVNSNNSSKQMLEMLSTMIPPEQKNTFEAMKILVDAGILK